MKCKRCGEDVYIVNDKWLCGRCINAIIRKKELPKLKLKVLERDNFICQECKKKQGSYQKGILLTDNKIDELTDEENYELEWKSMEVHHIKPLYLGGEDKIENLQTLCMECHKKKHKTRVNNLPPKKQT